MSETMYERKIGARSDYWREVCLSHSLDPDGVFKAASKPNPVYILLDGMDVMWSACNFDEVDVIPHTYPPKEKSPKAIALELEV